jgi:hypothetical protein
MKAKLEKLILTVGTHTLELTLEEAKELQRVLNETLSPRNVFPVIERVVEKSVPYPQWGLPMFTRDTTTPHWLPEIIC